MQKRVDKHGRYISAHQQGLKARHQLTVRGLVVLVIVIFAIVAAFSAALFWKAHNIGKIEKMLNETNKEVAEHEDIIKNKLKEEIQENIKADIMRTMKIDCQQDQKKGDGIMTDIAPATPSSKCIINWK